MQDQLAQSSSGDLTKEPSKYKHWAQQKAEVSPRLMRTIQHRAHQRTLEKDAGIINLAERSLIDENAGQIIIT